MSVLEKVYETGRKCAAGFKESMKIAFDKCSQSGTTVRSHSHVKSGSYSRPVP